MSPTDERGSENDQPEAGRSGWRIINRLGLLVLAIVMAVALAVLLPAVNNSREASRRRACQSNLKQIGLAIHNYGQAQKVFPPGTVCTESPWSFATPNLQPANTVGWNVCGEAADATNAPAIYPKANLQGTGFLLRILPYIEGNPIAKNWIWSLPISSTAAIAPYNTPNFNLAITDIKGFYCPTRRSALRAGADTPTLFSWAGSNAPNWTGGGTDYGGCAGRHAIWPKSGSKYNYVDGNQGSCTLFNGVEQLEMGTMYVPAPGSSKDPTPQTAYATRFTGIFGLTNQSVTFGQVRDGLSNTLLTGELQRITTFTGSNGANSIDGWAMGGIATLFTTGEMQAGSGASVSSTTTGGLMMNNLWFASPGSDHPNGCNMGLADGSVTFVSSAMDADVFALMGSMADGLPTWNEP